MPSRQQVISTLNYDDIRSDHLKKVWQGSWLVVFHSLWCHQMETFSALLALCEGNPSVTGGFPSHFRPVTWSLIFSLICAWTNSWANNRDTGDSRCHRSHYDVTVMYGLLPVILPICFRVIPSSFGWEGEPVISIEITRFLTSSQHPT